MDLGFGFQFSLVSKTYNLIYLFWVCKSSSFTLACGFAEGCLCCGPWYLLNIEQVCTEAVLCLAGCWHISATVMGGEKHAAVINIDRPPGEPPEAENCGCSHTALPWKFPHSVKRARTFVGWTAAETVSTEGNLSAGVPAWKHKSLKTQSLASIWKALDGSPSFRTSSRFPWVIMEKRVMGQLLHRSSPSIPNVVQWEGYLVVNHLHVSFHLKVGVLGSFLVLW